MSFVQSHKLEEIILSFGYEQDDICVDFCRYRATPAALKENPDIAKIITINPPRHVDGVGHAYDRDYCLDLITTYLVGVNDNSGEKIYAILSE